MTEPTSGKERIVILGGGVSAITTAYWLTNQPDWQDRYDVTVYQMGWRLGGKCGSGRNRKVADRIEEHGLHILLGFYENTFRTLRHCYRELGERGLRDPNAPNGTWEKAFHPATNVTLCEHVDDRWIPWTMTLPQNDLTPGDPDRVATRMGAWDLVVEMISHLLGRCTDSPHCANMGSAGPAAAELHPSLWQRLCQGVAGVEQRAECGFLSLAHQLATSLPKNSDEHLASSHQDLLWLLEKFVEVLWACLEHQVEEDDTARRLYIEVCLGYATIRGIITDGVLTQGFSCIDQYNFKEWLGRHLTGVPGDHEMLLYSAVVRGTYDLFFSFLHGDYWTPTKMGQFAMAAGSGLHFMMQGAFAYKGAVYYRMMGGTGDVILGPLYQVLAARGVRFEFFHRAKNLGLSAEDPKAVGSITLGRQVTLKDPAAGYQPLYDVKGLPCWPSEPLYEQLSAADAQALQEGEIDLESAWSPWQEREQDVVLKRGEHFDRIVLGIPVAALPFLCPELIAADERWQKMVTEIQTVKTVAAQYWLKPTLSDLGWQGLPAMMDAFVEPLNSWADHADLVPLEDWPAQQVVGDMAVLCGPMPDDPLVDPPFSDHDYPAQQKARAEAYSRQWLAEASGKIWPNGSPGGQFDWDLLVDLEERSGEARFDAQYYRANIDPTERYTISVPGSTQYRLSPNDSGFSNLVLCGDWTLNSINMGCVEGTVESGMLASQAISGFPEVIHG